MRSMTNHFRRYSHWVLWLSLSLWIILPSLLIIAAAFLSYDQFHLIKLPFSLAAFHNIAHSLYPVLMIQTLSMALQVTLICLVISYPCALALQQLPTAWKKLGLVAIIIPFWTSTLIRTYAILSLLKAKGWLSLWLLKLGIISQPLDIAFTPTAVLIGLAYDLLPMMLLPIYLAIHAIDLSLYEAAQDLGAHAWQRFWFVTWPLTRNGAILGCLLVGLPAMGLFYVPEILGGAKGLMLGNLINDAFNAGNWPLGAALCLCLMAPLGLLLACTHLYRWVRS
jgi:spermidine/putrescine transport system permease protein